jgi:DNA helicase HerA-like ATPase
MKPIKLSPELELPGDAATQKLAFLARSGAGKTYGAGVFVEQLVAAGNQVVVIDPVGVWWGLRLAADGKRPGIGTIYVFGGQRGDVPLEHAAGELVANLIVDLGISVVLDVSDMTGGEMKRFMADFACTCCGARRRPARR